MFEYEPTLNGELVRLRPLCEEDFDQLYDVASDPLIWEQHPVSTRYQPDEFRRFFESALDSDGALVIIDANSNQAIGSSRFHGYNETTGEVEIGWTFLARSCWGGKYNAEVKRLMLDHAFRFVDKVILLIGPDNIRSQRAAEKIGALRVGMRTDANGHAAYVYQVDRA